MQAWLCGRSGIQAKSRDHGKGVAVSSIDRDPFSLAATSVGPQFGSNLNGDADKTGAGQSVRDKAGAIITAVMERTVAAPVPIRFRPQLIRRPDGALDRLRRVCWSRSH